jgi:hypothetical protein
MASRHGMESVWNLRVEDGLRPYSAASILRSFIKDENIGRTARFEHGCFVHDFSATKPLLSTISIHDMRTLTKIPRFQCSATTGLTFSH